MAASAPLVQHLRDLIAFLTVLLGPLPLGVSLVLITQSDEERLSLSHCVFTLLVVWCAVQTSIGLLLGAARVLTFTAVLLGQLAAFLLGTACYASLRRRVSPFSLGGLLRSGLPLSSVEMLILAAVLAVGLGLAERVMTQPIVEYDSLAYHLPVMAKWHHEAAFTMLDQFGQISRYPYNWEVLCTLFLMPFREDFLVACPNLMAWMLFGLSAYLLSVRVGATRVQGMASSALLLALPILMDQVNTMRVDIPLAAFFMASLYSVAVYGQTGSPSCFALSLAALGMLCGIKASGLAYGFLPVAALAALVVRALFLRESGRRPGRLHRFAVPLGIAGVLCFLFLGGFWYVRNLIEIGNPIGYITVGLGDRVVFPGDSRITARIRRTTLASLFELTNLTHWRILAEQVKLWLQVPFVVMALQALLSFVVFVGDKRRVRSRLLLPLLALAAMTALLYWMTPYSADNGENQWQITPWMGGGLRYALPLMGVLAVVSAAGATAARLPDDCILALVLFSLGSAVASNLLYVAFYVVVALLLHRKVFGLIDRIACMATARRKRIAPAGRMAIAALFVGAMVATTWVAREVRDDRRSEAYGAVFDYVATNVGKDEAIGYLLSHRSYLLYGKNLDREVIYVPSESDSLSEWADTLEERGVGFVAMGPLRPSWRASREVEWLANTEGPFVRIAGEDPEVELVLFRLGGSQSRG